MTKADEYFEAEDALYQHEAPFYRACALGGHFVRTTEWQIKREKLEANCRRLLEELEMEKTGKSDIDPVQLAKDLAKSEIAQEDFDNAVAVEKQKIREGKKKKPLKVRIAEALIGKPIEEPKPLPEDVQVSIYELDGSCIKTFLYTPFDHRRCVDIPIYEGAEYKGKKTVEIDIRRLYQAKTQIL